MVHPRSTKNAGRRSNVYASSIIIPSALMKRVIGRGSEAFQDICSRSGAHCNEDSRRPLFFGTNTISISGTIRQIDYAKSLIRNVAGEVNPQTGEMIPGVVHEDAPHKEWKNVDRMCQPYPLDNLRYDKSTRLPDFRKQWIEYYVLIGDFDSANALNAEVISEEKKYNYRQPNQVDWEWNEWEAWQADKKKEILAFKEVKQTLTKTSQAVSIKNISPQKKVLPSKVICQNEEKTSVKNLSENSLSKSIGVVNKSSFEEGMSAVEENVKTCPSDCQTKMQTQILSPDDDDSSSSGECDEFCRKCQFKTVIEGEKHLQHKHKWAAYYRDKGKIAEAETIENAIAQTKVVAVSTRIQSRKRAGENIHYKHFDDDNDDVTYEGDEDDYEEQISSDCSESSPPKKLYKRIIQTE